MGFLQSVFERFLPEHMSISSGLQNRGIDCFEADNLGEMTASGVLRPTAFVYDAERIAFNHGKDAAVKALNFLQDRAAGHTYASFEIKNANFAGCSLKPPAFRTKHIGLRNCSFPEESLTSFLDALPQSGAESLEIGDTACTGSLKGFKTGNRLTEIAFKNTRPDRDDLANLAKAVSGSDLTRFTLNEKQADPRKTADVIKALPASLKTLNLAECPMDDACVTALAEKLPALKNVENIILSNCKLSAAHVETLANALPAGVAKFDLSGAEISDKALKALIKSATRPESVLHETNIVPNVTSVTDPDPRYTQSLGADLTIAEFDNKRKYFDALHKAKAEKIAQLSATGKKNAIREIAALKNQREH